MGNEILTKIGEKAEWAQAGNGPLEVTITVNSSTGELQSSHTGKEISQMLSNGQQLYFNTIDATGEKIPFSFFACSRDKSFVILMSISKNEDNKWQEVIFLIPDNSNTVKMGTGTIFTII